MKMLQAGKRFIATGMGLCLAMAGGIRAHAAVQAGGGAIVDSSAYRTHTFTNNGTFSVAAGGEVEVLVVAGGGGGGGGAMAGGGGAGGVIYTTAYPVATGDYTVMIGEGGLGGFAYNLTFQTGVKGTDSSFGTSLVALGGGGGSGWDGNPSTSGGSGGGGNSSQAASAGTAGQGYAGNIGSGTSGQRSGGGGGGAGEMGGLGTAGAGGKGGDGIEVFGSYFGGGGGGGLEGTPLTADGGGAGGLGGGGAGSKGSTKAIDADPNTGGGGGGAGYTAASTGRLGGNGGSGIVIVRYLLPVTNAGGATNITASSAWLNGTLYATGTSSTAVAVYWGPSDGGTNANAWANTNDWASPQTPGDFTYPATGLSSPACYYYRFSAVLDGAVVWASASASFITGEISLALESNADEATLTPGAFTVTRPGTTTNEPLTVTYAQTGGTATSSVDFAPLSGSVTIPAGTDSAEIVVAPLKNYLLLEDTTLELTLTGAPAIIGTAGNATLTIMNEQLPAGSTNVWIRTGSDAKASTAANWSLGHSPTHGETVYLGPYSPLPDMTWDVTNTVAGWVQSAEYAGTVTFATTFPGHAFPVFTIDGNAMLDKGTWTHTANPAGNAEINRLSVKISGDLTLGSNAFINVDGKGFAAGAYGPGKGVGENYAGYGASHGGWDAERQSAGPYGSVVCPTNLGSSCSARAGGGAVLLEVEGHGQIDGTVSAIGINVDISTGYNAGAGGSILIRSGTLGGKGLLNARGGRAFYGGSAGGGRIAMIVTNSESFGGVRAMAGGGANGPGNYVNFEGSAGTIYQEHAGHQPDQGILVIAEYNTVSRYGMPNWPVTEMPKASAWNSAVNLDDFSRIVITNGGNLGIVADTIMTNWSLARLQGAGPENSFITVRSTNGVAFPPQMTVSNYSLQLDVPVAAAGDWRIASSGNLSHTFWHSLNLALSGNLMVDAGGMISAHRRGYNSGGPGGAGANYAAGPSHGGRGGIGYIPFRATYGSVLGPTNWGSQNNTRGGGAVKLDVSGTVTVNGTVDANGDMTFAANAYYGSGSGGSVWLQSGTFAGSGTISAAGGNGYIGPGGGGRISLVERAGSGISNLGVDARGGYSAQNRYSAPGTIYRQPATRPDGAGTLTVSAPATWNPGTNLAGTNTYCELPPALLAVPNELKQTTLRIEQHGRVGLSGNLTVGDLYLVNGAASMPQLILNGHTLKVNSYYHSDWGSEAWVVYGGGQIVWKSGTLLLVR